MEKKPSAPEMLQSTAEEQKKTLSIVPRFYRGLLAAFLLLILAFLYWSVFGTVSRTVTVTGVYHPREGHRGDFVALVPLSIGKPLEVGMEAIVFLTGYDYQKIGHMEATIVDVDESVTTLEEMRELLMEDTIISAFSQSGPTVAVRLTLRRDPDSSNGYYWSAAAGRDLKVYDMTLASIVITREKVHPISLWIPQLQTSLGL